MMLVYFLPCLVALISSLTINGAESVACGDTITNRTTGSLGVPTGLAANKTCTVVILRSEDDNITAVQISSLKVAAGDKLLIYDGDTTLLANLTGQTVSSQVLVAFQLNTVIKYTPRVVPATSVWSMEFNTQECNVAVQNSWSTSVMSPTYAATSPGTTLMCTYKVYSFLPSGFVAAAAFTGFNLAGNSSLVYSEGSQTFDESSGAADFFADGSQPLTLTLNILDTSVKQNFSLVVEPVLQECSGSVSVNGSLNVVKTVPSQTSQAEGRVASCRWQLSTSRQILLAVVNSVQLVSGDILSFRSGLNSQAGKVLDTVTSNVDDYLVVTSGNTFTLTFTLAIASEARQLDITFMDADYGGLIKDAGSLTVGNDSTSESVHFLLEASDGQWADVSVKSNITSGSTVKFYDGAQTSDSLLTIWSSEAEVMSPVTGHERMLVVLSNLTEGESFSADFTSVDAGCDSVSSASSGQMAFTATSTLTKDQTCAWTVAPLDKEGTIVLSIVSVNLRDKESVIVSSGWREAGNQLAYFSGSQAADISPLPEVYATASDGLRISFTRLAAASAATSVVVQYRVIKDACGGAVSQTPGQIQTPNYPNQYPLNAACSWTFSSGASKPLLLLSFTALDLAQKQHSVSVSNNEKVLAKYGGVSQSAASLPNDLILPSATDLALTFSSMPDSDSAFLSTANQVGGGASLNYWILECGGNITSANGSFTSPEFSKAPTKSALCVWIVDVSKVKKEEDSTNIVSLNITAKGADASTVLKYLKVYDGSSLRSPLLSISELTSNLSRYDSMVVVFNYTYDSKVDVRVNVSFETVNCNSSQLCDNGICMHQDWICNGHDDCGDDSDEQHCIIPPPTPSPQPTPAPQSYDGWVKAGWVPGCLFIGLLLGVGLVILVPRLIRYFTRGRSGNYNRMGDPAV